MKVKSPEVRVTIGCLCGSFNYACDLAKKAAIAVFEQRTDSFKYDESKHEIELKFVCCKTPTDDMKYGYIFMACCVIKN